MPPSFRLRATTDSDSDALAELGAQSPDSGRVAFSQRYRVPFLEVMRVRHPDGVGVVAEDPGHDGLVGAAWVSFDACRLSSRDVPYALLHSLVVHPDHRRQGIAGAMTRWRLDLADQRGGAMLIMAGIQNGNNGSLANARTWANHVIGPMEVVPVPMRSRAPHPVQGLVVRAATPSDLEQIAAGLNVFYDGFDLTRSYDAEGLATWMAQSPLDEPVNHYLVAVDRSGRVRAGLGIQEEARLTTMYVTHMPRLLELANRVAKVVPRDREMRNVVLQMPWFEADHLDAARHLWQTVRWDWRDRGSSLLTNIDPRSPLRHMLQRPGWLPRSSIRVALRSERPPDQQRLLAAPI